MSEIGKINRLLVVKEVEFGLYLDGGEHGEILLPKRYVPKGIGPDDVLNVFIYLDSEDRLIATTETPYAMVDEFALLKVISVNSTGAFLDWGLMKDLLVPFSEQKQKMEEGKSYIVHIYLDEESNRITASAKIEKFLDLIPLDVEVGDEVNLFICNRTDLGYNAIVNDSYMGVLYHSEVFTNLERGEKLTGYIKNIREDDKIDLTLHKPGYSKVTDFSEQLLEAIKKQSGFLNLSDKSPAELIYEKFGVSKKTFKQAVGALYKKRLITIEENGIRLNSKKTI